MAKLTGPGGDDDARRDGSPGGAADSGVASGDECLTGGRDAHQDRYSHQLMADHDGSSVTTSRCSAAFASPSRWTAFPGLPDI